MTEHPPSHEDANMLESIVDRTLRTVNDADAYAAAQRVAEISTQRRLHDDALVEHLIRQKAQQTGGVGAATSAAALIPGFGSVAAFTVGVVTDVGVTLRLQSELVLEIAAARGRTLTPSEARNALLVVTGLNMGAERLINQASRKLAERTAERFAGRALIKAIPFVGIAISAGANILMTYIIGRRADAYFRVGPEAVGDWGDSIRAVTGVDERKLVGWLGNVMVDFGRLFVGGAQRLGSATQNAARRAGEVVAAQLGRRPRRKDE
ncbi:MAG: hypothetical protein WAU00_04180 [Caldilinea sp.]